MTRINVVPPSELHGKHLVAEYREIVRVFALVRARVGKGGVRSSTDIPEEYTLGAGHVTFFFDKLSFVLRRYSSLVEDMARRGYKSNRIPEEELRTGIPQEWFGEYTPTEKSLEINRERILLRMPKQR